MSYKTLFNKVAFLSLIISTRLFPNTINKKSHFAETNAKGGFNDAKRQPG